MPFAPSYTQDRAAPGSWQFGYNAQGEPIIPGSEGMNNLHMFSGAGLHYLKAAVGDNSPGQMTSPQTRALYTQFLSELQRTRMAGQLGLDPRTATMDQIHAAQAARPGADRFGHNGQIPSAANNWGRNPVTPTPDPGPPASGTAPTTPLPPISDPFTVANNTAPAPAPQPPTLTSSSVTPAPPQPADAITTTKGSTPTPPPTITPPIAASSQASAPSPFFPPQKKQPTPTPFGVQRPTFTGGPITATGGQFGVPKPSGTF
jgi:hypothetical protein